MSDAVVARIRSLPHFEGLQLPAYESLSSAGMDVRAAIAEGVVMTLKPMDRALIPTGLTVSFPPDYEIQIRPRSGLALKHGISCLNTPGTIDADYRGEIGVILITLGQADFEIRRGDRIAQMVVARLARLQWQVSDSLDDTVRGVGGFGSTGQ